MKVDISKKSEFLPFALLLPVVFFAFFSLTVLLRSSNPEFKLHSSDYDLNGTLPAMKPEKTIEEINQETALSLFVLTNQERKNDLVWNECLAEKAIERAEYIVNNDFFYHEDKNGDYPYKKMIPSCLDNGFQDAGENLSSESTDPQSIHQSLMNSPTHRDNILSEKYTQMGVGCFDDVCVQFFASPRIVQ